ALPRSVTIPYVHARFARGGGGSIVDVPTHEGSAFSSYGGGGGAAAIDTHEAATCPLPPSCRRTLNGVAHRTATGSRVPPRGAPQPVRPESNNISMVTTTIRITDSHLWSGLSG